MLTVNNTLASFLCSWWTYHTIREGVQVHRRLRSIFSSSFSPCISLFPLDHGNLRDATMFDHLKTFEVGISSRITKDYYERYPSKTSVETLMTAMTQTQILRGGDQSRRVCPETAVPNLWV